MLVKRIITIMLLAISVLSCSKNDDPVVPVPSIVFDVAQGLAVNGEYRMTGTITSEVKLLKVILTKEGASVPFLIDDSTARNKNTYSYSYLVTGITANTTVLIDIYDQNNTKTSASFLIRI